MADMANYKESPRFATCSQLGVIHPKIRWKLNLLSIGKHDCDTYK